MGVGMINSIIESFIGSRIKNYPEEVFRGFLVEDEWQIEDSTESNEPESINLTSYFVDLSVEYAITMKLILLNQFKINGNIIDSKKGTAVDIFFNVSHCSRALRTMNITSLREINESNVHVFFEHILRKVDGGLYSKRSLRKSIQTFLTEASRPGENFPDSPGIKISWHMFLESIKPIVCEEMDWSKWLSGGSLGGFPVEFALLILDESLKTINDKGVIKVALAYVNGIRNAQIEHGEINRVDFDQIFRMLINRECGKDEKGFHMIRIYNSGFIKKIYKSDPLANKGSKTFIIAKCIFEEYLKLGKKSDLFPGFVSTTKINEIIQNIMYACGAIIQILSGIRNSEFQSLKRSSLQKDVIGDTTFTSALKKSNHSIETVRMISNVAWDAAALAKSLHVPYPKQNKDEALDKLLRVNVPWRTTPICGDVWDGNGIPQRAKQSGLTNWMNSVLKSRISDIDLESFPNATSHRFRHTWVEIALRRFDGNVPEAVRQHFRHAYGSHNTMAYIRGKVKQDLPLLQRDYIRELIGRAGYGKEDLFGPVGYYILQRIKEVDVLSEDAIEEIVNEFDIIETYEYAYCMIPNSQRTQAKCFDKSTNLPNYNAARFELCVGCPGSLRIASHRDAIMRIGMKEQEVIASRDSQGLTLLADGSRQILKLCNYAIKEIDNKMPVNNNIDEDLSNEHV